MESERKGSLLVCFLLLAFVSQCYISPALCRSLEVNVVSGSVLKPDCDCDPTPATPSSHAPPKTPSHGSSGKPAPTHGSPVKPTPSTTPSTPSHGGGYYPSPSSHPTPVKPPSTPVITPPVAPTPTVPVTPTPTTPVTPTPSTPDRSTVPPFAPGSCSYWISHPDAIWSIIGYWGTIGKSFGAACSAAFGGKNLSLHDALTNPRTDGLGALYREGTAALLNSLSCNSFSFTPQQVKAAFAAAVGSDHAASAQAMVFKKANEGGAMH